MPLVGIVNSLWFVCIVENEAKRAVQDDAKNAKVKPKV